MKPVKKVPSKLIEDQISGKVLSDRHEKPEIIQFLNISDYSIYPNSKVTIDEPLFQPYPSVIQFSNYEPLQTQETILRLRNKDSVARRIKIITPESRLFTVSRAKSKEAANQGTKVAPGMEVSYVINFTPEAKIDYSYDLIAATEREKFIIPIRASGQRTMLSFPDVIDFGECMVKHSTEKPVIVSNIGEKPTKWKIVVNPPFYADRDEGFLELGAMDQLAISFRPNESRLFRDNLLLQYDQMEAHVDIMGEARNNPNVYLSKSFIHINDTYITLNSQESLKIINKTKVPVEFEWRAFANEREENEKKLRLNQQLAQEEAEERMRIEENLGDDSETESLDSDDSYDEVELKNMRDMKLKKAISALERKYKNIRKAVEDDLMLFQDDIFIIEPQSGKIWPDSEIQVTITFKPVSALHYSCKIYCNTTCLQERLELTLNAKGIGPRARLNYYEYDIGDVFINFKHYFDHINIENEGDINCEYNIIPYDTPFGSKFKFDAIQGTLDTFEPAKRHKLGFKFKSDILGEFSETFRIHLVGSSEILPLVLKGHVMAPSFEFDKEEIDFKEVSYNFVNPEIVKMKNTSQVPIEYSLRVPGDGKLLKKEFDINPSTGKLHPGEEVSIQVDFIPVSVRKYDMVLVVDIEGVGQDMHALPIKAESFVPKVEILVPNDLIDFEKVFLRHPYYFDLKMRNRSKLQAKFEILPQDESSTIVAEYTPDMQEGVIEGRAEINVKVKLLPQKGGQIRLPMYVKIIGENTQPHMLTLMALCSGPKIKVLTPELDFGKVTVLKDYQLKAVLLNKSDIEAKYVAFTRNKTSVFSIPEREGCLQPAERKEITIVCHADECIGFADTINFSIREGRDAEVVVKARGTGSTAFCKDNIDTVEFGTAFTSRMISQPFIIENRGRKPQKITWCRNEVKKDKKESKTDKSQSNATGKPGNKSKNKSKDEEEQYVFYIEPEVITLNPKTWIAFQFKANAPTPGNHSESFFAQAVIGKDRKTKVIFNTTLQGNFIEPFLQFSENVLHFRYVWENGVMMETMSKDLEITCVSSLATNFLLRCAPPFSINQERFQLDPGQTASLRVDFDPTMREDRQSGEIPQKLQIIHQDHPHRDNVDLLGEMWFPNLKIDTQLVDFGCILNQTQKKIYVEMKNTSILPVKYNWTFIEEEIVDPNQPAPVAEEVDDDEMPINEVFDILPVMGILGPGESETVEFVYNAFDGKKRQALALCEVEGGPEYEVALVGEGSTIRYQLNKYQLDFAQIPFNEQTSSDFLIENTGKVPFEFSINLETLSRPGILEIMPLQGKVFAKDKQKVVVKMTPGVPDKISEYFLVEVAHFNPIHFSIVAQGTYPALLLSLSRPETDTNYFGCFEEAKRKNPPPEGWVEPVPEIMSETIRTNAPQRGNRPPQIPKADPYLLEIESEADRISICRDIITATDEYFANAAKKSVGAMSTLTAKANLANMTNQQRDEILRKLVVGKWNCDFGFVVIGSTRKKPFRMTNVGQLPLTFAFDTKVLKSNGFNIEPSKVNRIPPGENVQFNITYTTNKKTMSFGQTRMVVPINIKTGLMYHLILSASLTSPDVQFSNESLEFGRVLLGTQCTAKVRMYNPREVVCEWEYDAKRLAPLGAKAELDKFQVYPTKGSIMPAAYGYIEIVFTPTADKQILQKLEFKIKDNVNKKCITCKGQGTAHTLEFDSPLVELGPVLPYRHDSYCIVEMKNTSEYNLEVYSTDFDTQFKEEEDMLKAYEGFEIPDTTEVDQTAVAAGSNVSVQSDKPSEKHKKEFQVLYFPPRQPGQPLWKEIVDSYNKKAALKKRAQQDREMTLKLQSEEEEEKEEAEEYFRKREEEMAYEEEVVPEITYPQFIPFEGRQNVIVWGRPGHGKSRLASSLAETHQRLLISPDEVINWHISNGTQLSETINEYLAQRQEELNVQMEAREKLLKQRKKFDDALVEPAQYRWLEPDVLEQAFKERFELPDCNAGVVIDDLKCEFWQDEATGVKLLQKLLNEQGIYLVVLERAAPSEEAEGEEAKVEAKEPVEGEEGEEAERDPDHIDLPELDEEADEAWEAKRTAVMEVWNKTESEPSVKEEGEEAEEAPVEEVKEEEAPPQEQEENPQAPSEQENAEEGEPVEEVPDAEENESPKGSQVDPAEEAPVEVVEEAFELVRLLVTIEVDDNTRKTLEKAMESVREPIFPDPNTLPLPPPKTMQIVARPKIRHRRHLQQHFSIYTPIDQTPLEEVEEPEKDKKDKRKQSEEPGTPSSKRSRASQKPPEKKMVRLNVNDDNLDKNQSRWVLKPKSSTYIYVKFFSQEIGTFESSLNFEIVGGNRQFNLPCKGSCEFPLINSNPLNIFMKRRKGRPANPPECFVSKEYIKSEGKFEFGSLLIGKTFDKRQDEKCQVNGENFRISNCGKYECTVDFGLRSAAEDSKSIFALETDTLQLKPDETQDLKVWAFPDTVNSFADELVCIIKDNPYPVVIPLSAKGEKPVVEIESDALKFERLILNQNSTKQIVLKSRCTIKTKWTLNLGDKMPEEFVISETSGELLPLEEKCIDVTFNAIKQAKFAHKLTLEVTDTENFGSKQDTKPINMEAEAFDINVNLNFGNETNIVDFGNIRVLEEVSKPVTIKNTGPYEIKYIFNMKTKATRQLFKISPDQGVLNPNQEAQITVTAMAEKEEQIPRKHVESNTRFRRNSVKLPVYDIKLQILEGTSEFEFQEIPINVNLNAVFSDYSINPIRNINFGPVQLGESRSRTFEIKNNGMFEFNYEIMEYDEDREFQAEIIRQEEQKEEGKKKGVADKKPPPGKKEAIQTVEIGNYKITPSSGTLAPESSVVIEVTFSTEGSKLHQKTLAIDISGRDPNDYPKGIPYELAGESCIPGIATHDLDSIFEEQTVVPSLAYIDSQQILSANVFAQEDMVFLFGTLIASTTPKGQVEQFKITNNNKIPCNVNLAVKPRTSSKSEGFAFEISPSQVRIPPHEHTYVKVAFRPTAMQTYGGIFEAIVDNGELNPKTGALRFELRGEGTLPTITQLHANVSEEGKSIMKFNKTRVGKRSQVEIMAKNDGYVPATVRFDMPFIKTFSFLDAMNATLQPKQSKSFSIEFLPDAAGAITHDLKMTTVNNPFECMTVQLQAEGYEEDIVFENLPNDVEDECHFGDCIINIEKSINFRMKNYSEDAIRFQWENKNGFIFSPSLGHIKPRGVKEVTVSFKSEEKASHKAVDTLCQTHHITQLSNARFKEWDNSMKDVRYITPSQHEAVIKFQEDQERKKREEEEAIAKKGAKAKNVPKKEEAKKEEDFEFPAEQEGEEASVQWFEVRKEPQFSEIDRTDKALSLKVFAEADYLRYACEVSEIKFKSTLMFATRNYRFSIRNDSAIAMNYRFKICHAKSGKLDAGPYSVSPRDGCIAPGCDEQITAKFSPYEVETSCERLLVFSLQNLEPGMEPLVIEMKGKSVRPVCHFELPPSYYREKKAQEMTPIDASQQIVEFESLGTRIKNTKRFYVVNPTSQGYEFEWELLEEEGTEDSRKQFKCATQRGTILSGKKSEMKFEYIPEIIGTHESYWKFRIPTEGIEQNFLVVGQVIEPNVVMEVGKVNFGPLLIGGKSKEIVKLVNQEHIPFSFAFSKSSIRGEDEYQDSLSIVPTSGTVPPQGFLPVEVLFRPKTEQEFNYNILCKVKRKSRPIVLNVKGVGYNIKHAVQYEDSTINATTGPTDITFGNFFINDETVRKVTVVNSGNFNFDFAWKKPNAVRHLSICPENATVRNGESVDIELKYFPNVEHEYTNARIALQIVSGPMYTFNLVGSGRKPGIQFSFHEYDFGPCFVLRTIMPRTTYLELANYDDTAVSIETDFEKTNTIDVQLAPGQVLLPTTANDPEREKKVLKVPIIFTPRAIEKCKETVAFDINGIHKMSAVIKGEGIPLKLELENGEQEYVNFGMVRVGGDITKTVNLLNKSKRPVRLQLIDNENDLKRNSVSFTPDEEFVIKPKEVVPIELRFNPNMRLPQFNGEIFMKFTNGETRKLLQATGTSHGIEIKLMEEIVSFGGVVQGSHSIKQVQVVNLGDVPCEFSWDVKSIASNFSISPSKGTVPANEDKYFDITFHPKRVDDMIRYDKVRCRVQDTDDLFITLLGKCLDQPSESMKELQFTSIVRQNTTQKVNIKNSSNKTWRINPAISSQTEQYFTGEPVVEIPASGNVDYEVTYFPMTMTSEEVKHEGTLFFPLPDGTALLYNMQGISQPPKPADIIETEIKAKQAHIQALHVENWLKVPQRFRVEWVIEGEPDPATLIRGANTIDVPGGASKEYKLNFLTYKIANTKFKVSFTNEKTGEFITYELLMKATQQDLIGVVELVASVRDTSSKVIMIENPLDTAVDITSDQVVVDNEYLVVNPPVLTIPPKSESGLELTYRPLLAGEAQANLTIKSPALGEYGYRLVLKGLPSTSQRSLHFNTSLGTELFNAFRFTHFAKKAAVYNVKIEKLAQEAGLPDFSVEKPTVEAPAVTSFEGAEVICNIKFEPSNLGDSRALLTLSSPDAGEYTCVLNGHSTPPKPQGPIKIGKGCNIEFKNPYNEALEFNIRFDNPVFSCTNKSPIRVDAKKPVQLAVQCKPVEGEVSSGRMIVSAADLPPWIYYLSSE